MAGAGDTIAAIATPPGRGGIGIIRISGALVTQITHQLVNKKVKPREAIFCSFLAADKKPIDNGIVIYYPQPASYTGEHIVELQGHGGSVVMSMLLARVLELGARQAHPGEFTERAFINGKIDLVQAESVAALIDSTSSQAARSAMRSLEGVFSRHIDTLLQTLTKLRVLVEGALDFPEEETDFIAKVDLRKKLLDCIGTLETITVTAEQGARLTEGLQLTIIGGPNVGKSSLLNRLVGKEAAIVNSTPGTTRDIIETNISLGGVPLNILDTAGLRETENDIEQEGIRRARKAARKADIIVLVAAFDRQNDLYSKQLLDAIPDKVKKIVVVNKIDLAPEKIRKNSGASADLYISAKTGEGIDSLVDTLKKCLDLPESEAGGFMARSRHLHALAKVHGFLSQGLRQLELGGSLELLAEELRLAQEALAVITGEFAADDLLGEIFADFCIGK